jgi:hypothetical protein
VFEIAVANTNDAPTVAAALAGVSIDEDAPFTFQVSAGASADADAGEALTFSAALADGGPLPAWLSFDPATRTFSGSPGNADVGTLAVRVTATDLAGASAVAVNEDATTANLWAALLANDTDPDAGDVLCIAAADPVSALGGTIAFDAATRTLT